MKAVLTLTTALFAVTPILHTQQAPAAAANPVVSSSLEIYSRQAQLMVAAADEMPAEKYSFRPTPDQRTFGEIVAHVAGSNGGVCGMISGTPAPPALKVAPTASKDELSAALNASFEFCGKALNNLQDAQLGDPIQFRGKTAPRARAVVELTADLADHYSQMAVYLRLSGLKPPSAMPRQ